MRRYFVATKNGRLFPNIIGTLYNADAKGFDNGYLYEVMEFNGKANIHLIYCNVENARFLDPESCEKIDELYQQIFELKKQIEEVVKKAKRRKAQVSDFHKVGET